MPRPLGLPNECPTRYHRSMKTGIIAGVVLGLLVVAWTFVMGVTGWYLDPSLAGLFALVVVIEVVVLVLTLRTTRHERDYFAQVGLGTLASVVASVIIFAGSILFTTVAYPTYFQDLRAVEEATLRAEGRSDAEVQAEIADSAQMQAPVAQATAGLMGTIATGIAASAVAALFLRKKKEGVELAT